MRTNLWIWTAFALALPGTAVMSTQTNDPPIVGAELVGPTSPLERGEDRLVRSRIPLRLFAFRSGFESRPIRVSAWVFGIRATGIRITQATVSGTWLEAAQENGAQVAIEIDPTEETLAFSVRFPEGSPKDIREVPDNQVLFLDVEGGETPGPIVSEVRFDSEIIPEGFARSNVVILETGQIAHASPLFGTKVVILDDATCGYELLGFSERIVRQGGLFEGILGGETASGEIVVPVGKGERGETHVFANAVLLPQRESRSLQAWSLGVELRGNAEPKDVAVRVSALGDFGGQYRNAQIIDPARNGGRRGFVCVRVLQPDLDVLPAGGTYSLLDMTIESPQPQALEDFVSDLRFFNGLVGAGLPIANVLGLSSGSASPCNLGSASATIRFRRSYGRFIRGDANGDSRIDISDPVTTLGRLFFRSSETVCFDAMEANADGRVDISDGVYLFNYLFLGGPEPAAPFPECGEEEPDGVGCAATQPACGGFLGQRFRHSGSPTSTHAAQSRSA